VAAQALDHLHARPSEGHLSWADADRGWTALFFLDEAVRWRRGTGPATIAGGRPIGAYRTAWARAEGTEPDHSAMDNALHAARVTRQRAQIRHRGCLRDLPDGAFVLHEGRAHLVLGDALLPFDPSGYGQPVGRPAGEATILTPPPSIAALGHGFRPVLHPSATPAA
jgi:hypothetical protein